MKMNEEIKEILEDIKKKELAPTDLTHNDIVKLLNYITNLQEEKQKLRQKIKYMEMIMEYKNELRQPQDESEIHNELYR